MILKILRRLVFLTLLGKLLLVLCFELGGEFVECEADKVCFRTKVEKNQEDASNPQITWLRYIAIFVRGSSKFFLGRLPNRFSAGAGQGGGGALSVESWYIF